MTDAVLWYVHDHGRGHLQRARAVLAHLRAPVVVAAGPHVADLAAATLDVPVVRLPPDTTSGRPTPRGPWHPAPIGRLLRDRHVQLVRAVDAHECTTAVVDVSMEVTALTSLLGLRTISVRQSGCRTDDAHRVGLSCADVVWVPQHRALEPISEPTDDRWHFTGAFSRYDDLPPAADPAEPRIALIVLGAGGSTFDEAAWRDAAAPPGWCVVIAGGRARWRRGNVRAVGTVDPLHPLLCAASTVVAGAGWASTADVAAIRRPLVVVPEPRPFDEQLVRARALAAAGLALHVDTWPTPTRLADVLAEAGTLDPAAWAEFHDGHGARRAATMIDAVHGSPIAERDR